MPIRNDFFDAVRGLAALAVLAFHCGYLPIGWAGVPVFFALSGYLITKQLARPAMGAIDFWCRRAQRILPLLYLYLAVNAVSAVCQGRDLTGYAWHILGASDQMIAAGAAIDHGHIGHLWSIAVELQVYAVWPVLFLLPARARLCAFVTLAAVGSWNWSHLAHACTLAGSIGFFAVGGIAAHLGWTPPAWRVPSVLSSIGRAGFSIYLWQMMIVGLCARLGQPLAAFPLGIAAGYVSFLLFEHQPAIRPKLTNAEWTPSAVTGTACGLATGAPPKNPMPV